MIKRTAFAVALLALTALIAFFATERAPHRLNEQLEQADSYYKIGETAQNLAEKEDAFNHALTLYLQLEQQRQPANGKLYTNIGNTYFQLNLIPQAILYYNRALKLEPNDPKSSHNLAISNDKLHLPAPESPPFLTSSLLYRIFTFFACLSIALLSFTLWGGKEKVFSWLATLIALALLVFIGYRHYFTPLGGILVKTSGLYLDAGEQYAQVLDKPLPAGLKVEVLSDAKEGVWIKIRTKEGAVGFIPENSLRVI